MDDLVSGSMIVCDQVEQAWRDTDEEYETIEFSSIEDAWKWTERHLTPPASNMRLWRGTVLTCRWWCPKNE